jgi:hypothetical protein
MRVISDLERRSNCDRVCGPCVVTQWSQFARVGRPGRYLLHGKPKRNEDEQGQAGGDGATIGGWASYSRYSRGQPAGRRRRVALHRTVAVAPLVLGSD